MEAGERGSGMQRAGDGQGHSGAARGLPRNKASNIQGNATGSTKGKDGESNGAGLAERKLLTEPSE